MFQEKLWAWRRRLDSLGLQRRIFLLTAAGMLISLSLFGLLGVRAVQESTRRALDQQLVIAQLVADHLDRELALGLDLLGRVASRSEMDLDDGHLEPEQGILRQAHQELTLFTRHLSLLDAQGQVLWVEPPDPALLGVSMADQPSVRETLANGIPTVSGVTYGQASSTPIVILAVPVQRQSPARGDAVGQVTGALCGEIEVGRSGFSDFLKGLKLGRTGHIEVMDREGIVLAATHDATLLQKGDHASTMAELIEAGRPAVRGCHQCHDGGDVAVRRDEVLAFAPLKVAPWGVAVRQQEAEALAPVRDLQRQLALGGLVIMVAALLVAWVTTGQVVRPLRALSRAAERIAEGHLDEPINCCRGEDELGRLATSFEEMRQRLRAFLDEQRGFLEQQRRWSEALEERVQARTRELATLYEQLRLKEEARSRLLAKLVTAQEEERRRIARELHDEVGQALTAIIMNSAALEQAIPAEHTLARAKLSAVRTMAAQALRELRSLIFDLRPEVLDDLGLVLAVRGHVKERLEDAGIRTQVDVIGLRERLPQEVEITVFRLIQEAVNNIARHAQATRAYVRVEYTDDGCLQVVVEDNGKGFDPRVVMEAGRGAGWGLRGMNERVALLGGRLHIESEPGKGTRLSAEIPMED